MALTDVAEGTIVRAITRLDETCREVRDAARVIGDAALMRKMEDAQGKIKRDSECLFDLVPLSLRSLLLVILLPIRKDLVLYTGFSRHELRIVASKGLSMSRSSVLSPFSSFGSPHLHIFAFRVFGFLSSL